MWPISIVKILTSLIFREVQTENTVRSCYGPKSLKFRKTESAKFSKNVN